MAEAVIPNVTIRTETRVSRIEGFPESVGTSMDHAAPVRLQHINRLIKELNANKRLAQVMPGRARSSTGRHPTGSSRTGYPDHVRVLRGPDEFTAGEN